MGRNRHFNKQCIFGIATILLTLIGLFGFVTSASAATPNFAPKAEQELRQLVNNRRAVVGVAPLSDDPCLDGAARVRALKLAADNLPLTEASHDLKPASKCDPPHAGENLGKAILACSRPTAANPCTVQLTKNIYGDFMDEPTTACGSNHRDNIETYSFKRMGVAVYVDSRNQLWVTQEFGSDITCNPSVTPTPITPVTPVTPQGSNPGFVGIARTADNRGYWRVQSNGMVNAFGNAKKYGKETKVDANHAIVGMAAIPNGRGYWLVSRNGAIYAHGGAKSHGSMAGKKLHSPIVGMAATPTGRGYWLVSSDGGVFAFGNAKFHGSTGANKLKSPIVGIASTRGGNGYWLVSRNGGVFSFGKAKFHGSAGAMHLANPVTGITTTPDGKGYWLVGNRGRVIAFGSARSYGPKKGTQLPPAIMGMTATSGGKGYWLISSHGDIYAFGAAPKF